MTLFAQIHKWLKESIALSWESNHIPKDRYNIDRVAALIEKCYTSYGGNLKLSVIDEGRFFVLKGTRELYGKFCIKPFAHVVMPDEDIDPVVTKKNK